MKRLIITDATYHGSSFFIIHFISNAFHFDIDNTTPHILGKPSGTSISFCVSWLEVSTYPEGPATATLTRLQANAEIVPFFQVATTRLSRSPLGLNYSLSAAATKLRFQIKQVTINHKIKILRPLSRATTSCHSYKKTRFLCPQNKVPLLVFPSALACAYTILPIA
jgi:hypothetical protein